MPLVRIKSLLEDARKNKYCLGSFNVFNIETLEGVLEAANTLHSPIICAVYEPHIRHTGLEIFSNLIRDAANSVEIPVVLHIDHVREISTIEKAIKCGFTSLMFDGPPNISFQEKIIQTRNVVEIAHRNNLTVEAELGRVTRMGIDDHDMERNITDPNLVQEFVRKTGVDILAPAVGSVSGMDTQRASIRLELLKQIKKETHCHLSLHGGSGIDDGILRKMIDAGINKASVYTKISNVAIQRIKGIVNSSTPDLPVLMREVRDVFIEMVKDRLEVFRSKDICI